MEFNQEIQDFFWFFSSFDVLNSHTSLISLHIFSCNVVTYPEIGNANFKCALWTFKQLPALKCEGVVEFPLFSFMVNPHRASAAMLALPLPMEYNATLGNGEGDRFPSVTQASIDDAAGAADA